MRRVDVRASSGSTEVIAGRGAIAELPAVIDALEPRMLMLVADRKVHGLHWEPLASLFAGPKLVTHLIDGEKAKSLGEAQRILEEMSALGFLKDDLVVSFGGGVASDLGGFVASVYARGVPVVHIPTTLLGQVDAAIGGKTGVNLPQGKNLVGTYHQPRVVVADVDLLSTLDLEEWRSGMAEVLKYALCFEPDMLDDLARGETLNHDLATQEDIIVRCIGIKAKVVAADERDSGARLVLNYGHTVGHALEAASGYSMRHGEAVAVGMAFASRLAVRHGVADPGLVQVHLDALASLGLPATASFDRAAVASAWSRDKKRRSAQRWVLLEAPGSPVVREDVPDALAEEVLEEVAQ